MAEFYGLYCPYTNELRYIGKSNNSDKRLLSHIRDSRRRNTPLYCWMRKLAQSQKIPVLKVLSAVPQNDWQKEEKQLISMYNEMGFRLLNVALGGDEPYCDIAIRKENGRKVSKSIQADPIKRKIWHYKLIMGQKLKWLLDNGCIETYNRCVLKLKLAAAKHPEYFGSYLNLKEI